MATNLRQELLEHLFLDPDHWQNLTLEDLQTMHRTAHEQRTDWDHNHDGEN